MEKLYEQYLDEGISEKIIGGLALYVYGILILGGIFLYLDIRRVKRLVEKITPHITYLIEKTKITGGSKLAAASKMLFIELSKYPEQIAVKAVAKGEYTDLIRADYSKLYVKYMHEVLRSMARSMDKQGKVREYKTSFFFSSASPVPFTENMDDIWDKIPDSREKYFLSHVQNVTSIIMKKDASILKTYQPVFDQINKIIDKLGKQEIKKQKENNR
jgi:hypothetical protein